MHFEHAYALAIDGTEVVCPLCRRRLTNLDLVLCMQKVLALPVQGSGSR